MVSKIHGEASEHIIKKRRCYRSCQGGCYHTRDYEDLLHRSLSEHNLIDNPGLIYVDETGMSFEHSAPRIIPKKGKSKVRDRTSGNKSQVAVVGCVSAAGHVIPPFVTFDAKRLIEWGVEGQIPGTTYGLSRKGWG